MNSEIFSSALVGHLVGDYLLQNDWMALNKKKSTLVCAMHCFIWTGCVMIFSGWQFLPNGLRPGVIFLTLFATHFIQDRTNIIAFWMKRIIIQPNFSKPPMAPWSIIAVDNVWHILTIWIVWRFL